MSEKEQIQIAEKNLDRLLEWISRYDTKSSIILGIDTGMLAILVSFAPQINSLNKSMIFLAIISVLILGLSLFFLYLGSYPQTKPPGSSLIFFGSICKFSSEEYKKIFYEQEEKEYLNDLLEQCHRNSEIIASKFNNLKIAYRMLLIGIIPWAITIFLFKIGTVPQ